MKVSAQRKHKNTLWYASKDLMRELETETFDCLTVALQSFVCMDGSGEVLLPAKETDEFLASYAPSSHPFLQIGRFSIASRQRYAMVNGRTSEVTLLRDEKTKLRYLVVMGAGICPLTMLTGQNQ